MYICGAYTGAYAKTRDVDMLNWPAGNAKVLKIQYFSTNTAMCDRLTWPASDSKVLKIDCYLSNTAVCNRFPGPAQPSQISGSTWLAGCPAGPNRPWSLDSAARSGSKRLGRPTWPSKATRSDPSRPT